MLETRRTLWLGRESMYSQMRIALGSLGLGFLTIWRGGFSRLAPFAPFFVHLAYCPSEFQERGDMG